MSKPEAQAPADQINVTEEMGIHKDWYAQARTQTLDTLPAFLNHLFTAYQHDYGTICHAIAAAAIGAATAGDKSEQGGITGFQGGFIMWQFVREWQRWDCPLSLTKWEDALYPQYEDRFAPTISKGTLQWLQEQAKKNLAEGGQAHIAVKRHWKKLAKGGVPFGLRVTE